MNQRDPQLKIRLKPKNKAWLEGKARKDDRSQNWLINHLIEEEIEREEQKAVQK
ncbi:hypothetical protein [Halomonas sp. H2]|uniref:hypothetical protein n=1 Tax=unclassified Halomonas TaxID=2609666 RepID=UPI003CF4C9DD